MLSKRSAADTAVAVNDRLVYDGFETLITVTPLTFVARSNSCYLPSLAAENLANSQVTD